MNDRVVIVDACRTAIGKMGGTLKNVNACDLASALIKEFLDRYQCIADQIDEVILGQCRQSSDESNVARVASLKAGIPEKTPAFTVMRQCASGMTAVHDAFLRIKTGESNIIIAGGTESMSNGIYYLKNARWGIKSGDAMLIDALTEAQFNSQPQNIYGHYNMGATAENIAQTMGISRMEQDEFALESQRKAAKAIQNGRFKEEIVPIVVEQERKKEKIIFDTDEFPKFDTSAEKLRKLKPCFGIAKDENGRLFNDSKFEGTVTAGSSSGRNDGAAMLLLMSESTAKENHLKPIGVIKGIATAGCDPRLMGLGPVDAVKKVLKKTGITLENIGLIELNEAFAAQAIGCIKELGLGRKSKIINVNGGAIALGHPVGATGCRILVTLLHEMKKRNVKYGLATLCVAGGLGQAAVIELYE